MSTYVSGPYTSGQLLRDIRAVEDAITQQFLENGPTTSESDQRSVSARILDASQGRNACIWDDQGNPSIMVRVPSMTLADLGMGSYRDLHPAFLVGGTPIPEVWVAKYQAMRVGSGSEARALSLRGVEPTASIDFDDSRVACEQKGSGWHLMTNAEWVAIAMSCLASGWHPRGNNEYGRDHQRSDETGQHTYSNSSTNPQSGKVAAGTGPIGWSHDGSPFGVWDLNGNLWEWVGGMRLDGGEIQVIPDNDAASDGADHSSSSDQWRAIIQDGTLVEPGTAGALKYDATGAAGNGDALLNTVITSQSDGSGSTSSPFESLSAASGVTVPDILRLLGLAPVDGESYNSDRLYTRNAGERLPRRGGSWRFGSAAGVFALDLDIARSTASTAHVFRPAYLL